MTLLWICVGSALFMAGGSLIEFLARRRERRGFEIHAWLRSGPVLGANDARRKMLPSELGRLVADVEKVRAEGALANGGLEHLVLTREEEVRRSLVHPRMLVKVGPSLGLIGTLIPMGASLAALASGNLEAMAGQMVVAFTTTIIGLATGTLAYVVAVVRQRWVNETVYEQRYLAERMAGELVQV